MNTLRKNSGFTMVELIVTMAVFLLVIVAASNIFGNLLGQFKQQTGITETGIEGIIGLELLRSDIEQAGFGLPWVLNGVNYNEAANDPNTFQDDTAYNDSPGNAPRAFVHGAGAGLNTSDVLVIKATNVAINDAAQRYTYITNVGANNTMNIWRDTAGNVIRDENLRPNTLVATPVDRVIVLNPVTGSSQRILISSGGAFSTNFNSSPGLFAGAFQPPGNSFSSYLIYGINSDSDPAPRMPFNRADYYVRVPAADMPTRCATGTGILYKGVINHDNVGNHTELPLLDCVADLQVYFGLDTDNNGTTDLTGTLPAGANAETIRTQVKAVHVFILAHEGQIDRAFTFSNFSPACAACVRVGDDTGGRDFDLAASRIINWQNYRWKVYSMVIKPYNLR